MTQGHSLPYLNYALHCFHKNVNGKNEKYQEFYYNFRCTFSQANMLRYKNSYKKNSYRCLPVYIAKDNHNSF